MNVNKYIVEHLEKLVANGPEQVEAVVSDSTYIVGIPPTEQVPSVALTMKSYDRYSALLCNLEVSFMNGRVDDEGYLRQCAEAVCRRLTYLEEPLAVVELDPSEGLAQLRSDPPHQDNGIAVYWEALVWTKPRPRARLTRYCWQPGSRERETLVYPATFATLGRLTQDLTLSLLEEEKA